MNEKYTKTITQIAPSELLWSITTGIPKVIDVLSGLVLWTSEGRLGHPSEREGTGRTELPHYCQDILDLDETDPEAVRRYHRRYGPYWLPELYVSPQSPSAFVVGYPLGRFQAEVRRLRAAVSLGRAVAKGDSQGVAHWVSRFQRVEKVTWRILPDDAWRPSRYWRQGLRIDEGPLTPYVPTGRLEVRPYWETHTMWSDEVIDLRLGWLPLKPAGWDMIASSWARALEVDARSLVSLRDDEELLQLAKECLWDSLLVPAVRPYLEVRPQLFLSWELFQVADFVRLGIAADLARGMLPVRCENEGCRRYFLRTRSRQVHCSSECQHAQAVRRYRRRQKNKEAKVKRGPTKGRSRRKSNS